MKFLLLSSLLASASGFAPSFLPPSPSSTSISARRPFIAGNWKLNPSTVSEASSLASSIASSKTSSTPCDVAIFAPFPFLPAAAEAVKGSGVEVGAEFAYYEPKGAYTGMVAPSMISSVGCTWALAGHSERRTLFGESDAVVNKQVLSVLGGGMGVVLCIGETQEEYEKGLVNAVCSVQLKKGLEAVTAEQMDKVVIAYEPVWAIGTGLTCPAAEAQDVHAGCRAVLAEMYGQAVADAVRIQYGGSVSPETVDELMAMPDIDGALVGGASLVADKFQRIINYEVKVAA